MFNKNLIIFLSMFILSFNVLLATDNINKNLEKVSIQLQWLDQFQFAGYYIAKEKGFYQDVGLDVEIKKYTMGDNPIEKVLTNQSQYATGRTSLIVEKSKGKKLILISAILQASPLVLVTKKTSAIKTIQDFKNKKAMLTGTENSASIFAMISSYGILEKDINIVQSKHKMQSLIDGDVDIISAYTSNQVYQLKQKGIDILVFNPKDYGFDFYSDILFTSEYEYKNHPKRVDKFNKASLKGWKYAFLHIDETIDLIMKKYNSQKKSRAELKYEANELKKLAYYKTDILGNIEIHKIQRIYDIYNVMGFIQTPIDMDKFIIDDQIGQRLHILTNKEKKYLKEKKVIKMCVDPDWMPFEKIKDGKHIGFASDYMKFISDKIDTPIVFLDTNSWTQSIQQAKNRECDIYSIISITKERQKYMDFTVPYIELPIVIATSSTEIFIESIEQILDKKIGITKGYSVGVFLKEKYPNINIVDVESGNDGLSRVEKGEIFAYIDNLASINYKIQKNFIGTVKISGRLDMRIPYRVATRNDEPILHSIFDKMILNIDDITKQNIFNKWIVVKNGETRIDYTLIWQIICIAILIILVIFYWTIKLKKEVIKREEAEQNLKELNETLELRIEDRIYDLKLEKEKFETMFNGSKDAIGILDMKSNFLEVNQGYIDITGFTKDELLKTSCLALTVPQDIEPSKKAMEEVLKVGYIKNFEKDCIVKNDTFITVNMSMSLLRSPDRVLISVRDISEIKEKEKLLFEQSKMASMGEMIGNIAHQWRQPLSVISTGATGLRVQKEYDTLTDKFFIETCDMIDRNAQYLSKTIDDFRNFIKGDKKLEHLKINDTINSFLHLVEGTIKGSHLNIILDLEEDIKYDGYPNELIQCFINIFNNSKDVLKDLEEEQRYIFISTKIEKNNIIITFKDSGGGIPDEILSKIFEPYFTTKHKSQGTGLGLHMTYNLIVDGMNGNIKVENNTYEYENKTYTGAKFTIMLNR